MATYYVATNGNDTTGNGSGSTPWASLQKAVDSVSTGDTVIVRDGTYTAPVADHTGATCFACFNQKSGLAGAPIIFRAEHKWGAILDGRMAQNVDSGTTYGFWFFRGSSYITIQDFVITRIRNFALEITSNGLLPSCHIIFEGNKIYEIGRIEVTDGEGAGAGGTGGYMDTVAGHHHIYIRGNVFYNIGRLPSGVTQSVNKDHVFYSGGDVETGYPSNAYEIYFCYNICWGVSGNCVELHSSQGYIYNNVMAWSTLLNGQGCNFIQLMDTAGDTRIYNNIFYYPAPDSSSEKYAILNYTDSWIRLQVHHNMVIDGNMYPPDTIGYHPPAQFWTSGNSSNNYAPDCQAEGGEYGATDPLFVAASDRTAAFSAIDFHLQQTSPCVGAGYDLDQSYDFDGAIVKETPDIGAYQFVETPGTLKANKATFAIGGKSATLIMWDYSFPPIVNTYVSDGRIYHNTLCPALEFNAISRTNADLDYQIQVDISPTYDTLVGTKVLLDGYTPTYEEGDGAAGIHSTSYISLAQSFRPTSNCKLVSAKFLLYKSNTPTGDCYAKLYSATGTYGTTAKPNQLLATSNAVESATLSAVDRQYVEFIFAQPYSLVANTTYFIAFDRNLSGTNGAPLLYYDQTSPTHSGNMCGAVWYEDAYFWYDSEADQDLFFQVYKSGDEGLIHIDDVTTSDSGRFVCAEDAASPFGSSYHVTFTPESDLEDGKRYYWHVRAIDTQSLETGYWSQTQTFDIQQHKYFITPSILALNLAGKTATLSNQSEFYYTLSVVKGTFAVTGNTATLSSIHGKNLSAYRGVFTITSKTAIFYGQLQNAINDPGTDSGINDYFIVDSLPEWLVFTFEDVITGMDKTYTLDLKASQSYQINNICIETDSGSVKVDCLINQSIVTGIQNVAATTNIGEFTATANNQVNIGDRVSLRVYQVTGASSVLVGKLNFTLS